MRWITYIVAGLAFLFLAMLSFIGQRGVETYIYLGKQVPKRYINEIKQLGLLGPDESIEYFYSDAFLDIKKGMYFVTDKHLVIYNEAWEPPASIIPFDDITGLDIEYNQSFFEDSYVTVDDKVGWQYEFPISSEKKRDKDFYNYLLDQTDQIEVASAYRDEGLDVFVELSKDEIIRRFEFYKTHHGTELVAGDYYGNIQIPAMESLEKKLCREWDNELFNKFADMMMASKGNADETRIVVLSKVFKCQNKGVYTVLKQQEDDFMLELLDSDHSTISSSDPDYSKYSKQFEELRK